MSKCPAVTATQSECVSSDNRKKRAQLTSTGVFQEELVCERCKVRGGYVRKCCNSGVSSTTGAGAVEGESH